MFRLIILLALLLPSHLLADEGQRRHSPKLSVQGDAVVMAAADQVRFSVGVTSEAGNADAAMAANSKALLQVEKALIHAGLNKGEYSTGQFQLRPRWSPRPRNVDQNWRPEIIGYTVKNTLNVKTGQLERVGGMIEAATRAGSNDLGQLSFAIADPRSYRKQALTTAIANAREDAENAAKAAGMKLGAVQRIAVGQSAAPPVRPMAMDGMVRTMAAETAPPIIAPDDLQIRATVTVIYALESGEE